MATRPKRPCKYPGCAALVTSGYCEKHSKYNNRTREYDRYRGTPTERGYNSKWKRYSANFLKEHPLCVQCLKNGIVEPSRHTDHIIPVSGPDDPLFWDPSNHQPLCHSCHSRKTATEDGGFGNRPRG